MFVGEKTSNWQPYEKLYTLIPRSIVNNSTHRTFFTCSKSNQKTTEYANMFAKSANRLKSKEKNAK